MWARGLLGAALAAVVSAPVRGQAPPSPAAPAAAAPGRILRVATSTDAATLDPHATNAQFTWGLVWQIYETLVHRADDLKLAPGLATRWEQVEPGRWRFHLREGVRFHGGEPLTAEDVVFSIGRARAPTSNYGIYVDTVTGAEASGPLTVDVTTRTPDTALPDKLTRIVIMSRAWAEANRATAPQNFGAREEMHTARNTNGTGPYVIRRREVDSRTVMVRNDSWWGHAAGIARGNVGEYHHVILASDPTRVAALLSGEVDMVPVLPAQDVERIRRQANLRILDGQENRTVLLGMNQEAEELPGSDVRGRNPFRDVRVRQAIAQAIDMNAIRTRTLRGQAVPSGSMWTQYVNGWSEETDRRPAYDRDAARRLLTEAGYPNGFSVPFDCPVGTYDEACQAVAGMLAQVGVRATLNLQPNTIYLGRLQRRETAFYGLSWGVPTFDALYTMRSIMASRSVAGVASWNAGGYSNPRLDEIVAAVEREPDAERRRALIREGHALHNGDFGHIPLYHMVIPWAVRAGVTVTHRADNQYAVRDIRVD